MKTKVHRNKNATLKRISTLASVDDVHLKAKIFSRKQAMRICKPSSKVGEEKDRDQSIQFSISGPLSP